MLEHHTQDFMNETDLTVSIVIVTWNSEKDITECLQSLIVQDYPFINSIIVVDNNSSDSTVGIIEDKFPSIRLVQSKKNTFFTGGNNIGIKYALENYNSDFVMIINPDTKAQSNLVSELVRSAKKSNKIGIVGPKIKFWNNENEGKINSAGMVYDGFMQAYDRGFLEDDNGQFDTEEEVPAVTGCCMLLNKEMINQIGMFWLPLKMYLEDLEICIRAKKAGWKIIYTPNTTVGHKWMQSTNQNKLINLKKWNNRNWMLIALRHYPFLRKIAVVKNALPLAV